MFFNFRSGLLHHGQQVGQQVRQRGAEVGAERPLAHSHLLHHRLPGETRLVEED